MSLSSLTSLTDLPGNVDITISKYRYLWNNMGYQFILRGETDEITLGGIHGIFVYNILVTEGQLFEYMKALHASNDKRTFIINNKLVPEVNGNFISIDGSTEWNNLH